MLYILTYFFKFSNHELPALLSELNVGGLTSMLYLPGTLFEFFILTRGGNAPSFFKCPPILLAQTLMGAA